MFFFFVFLPFPFILVQTASRLFFMVLVMGYYVIGHYCSYTWLCCVCLHWFFPLSRHFIHCFILFCAPPLLHLRSIRRVFLPRSNTRLLTSLFLFPCRPASVKSRRPASSCFSLVWLGFDSVPKGNYCVLPMWSVEGENLRITLLVESTTSRVFISQRSGGGPQAGPHWLTPSLDSLKPSLENLVLYIQPVDSTQCCL